MIESAMGCGELQRASLHTRNYGDAQNANSSSRSGLP